jgi:hypothetical protein
MGRRKAQRPAERGVRRAETAVLVGAPSVVQAGICFHAID